MKQIFLHLLFSIWCFVYVKAQEKSDIEKTNIALTLFEIFDNEFKTSMSNRHQCPELEDRASQYGTACTSDSKKVTMSRDDFKNYFVCFCSPAYKIRSLTAEGILANIFVQYSAINALLSFTVCRIYYLYALPVPDEDRAFFCERMTSYLYVFQTIAIGDRIAEIDQIYELLAKTSSSAHTNQLQENRGVDAMNLSSQKDNFVELYYTLVRLNSITEFDKSPNVRVVSCIGDTNDLRRNTNESNIDNMYLDFYVEADMTKKEDDSADAAGLSISELYTFANMYFYAQEEGVVVRDEKYQEYYHYEAWDNLVRITRDHLCPMTNYFNKVLYGGEIVPCSTNDNKSFIPPMEESLKVWQHGATFMKIIESKNEDDGSKIIKILRTIRLITGPEEFENKLKQHKESLKSADPNLAADEFFLRKIGVNYSNNNDIDLLVENY